jgi:hypothetical protein
MKTPIIIKLDFEEEDLNNGVGAIALVDRPAIEVDFFAFNKYEFATYSDYPKAVSAAAERGIRLNEAVNNKCATQVGKVRAQQLAQGKPISEETIKRMFAYLSRAKEFYNPNDTEACGTISYLLWGGEPALGWSERKLAQIEREREMKAENEIVDSSFTELFSFIEQLPDTEFDNVIDFFNKIPLYTDKEIFCDISGDCNEEIAYKTNFSVISEDKQMLISPVMIPNKPILRRDTNGEDYYVYFTPKTVEKMAHGFIKNKFVDSINVQHDAGVKLTGAYVVESWLKKDDKDKSYSYGFDLPNGTWFVALKVEDTNLWQLVKSGVVKGLSLEGYFGKQTMLNNKEEDFVQVTTTGGTKLFVKEDTLVTFILDNKGDIASVAPDGSYELADGTTLVVKEGKANRFPG